MTENESKPGAIPPIGIGFRLACLSDSCIVARMAFLTKLAKCILPSGHWGGVDRRAGNQDPEQTSNSPLYLTFDDGPHPDTTPYLIELLEEAGVKATFFLIGKNVERYPDLVKQLHDAGHVIANHSYGHKFMPALKTSTIEREIVKTNDSIALITGGAPTLFRPPYGLMDMRAAACLREQQMTAVYWGSASEDWLLPGADRVVRRVMRCISPGLLIVLHEGALLKNQTVTAAKEIIYRSRDLGYQMQKVEVRA
ncbi:polysaccharide deacetylase family protein [bacterium]|nr:polysaccharide deacetylase family protein [bacterium]QQR57392.1 MAG: polysaccharide deacetylase family protein [Candidatus Melainabacteria bacterium]